MSSWCSSAASIAPAFCTGVVVAPRVVLTAAHCATAVKDMRIHYRDDDGRPVMIEVRAVATHPAYRADALTRRVVSIDLALVQTQTPLGGRFSAAELDDTGVVVVGQPLRIVGYGVGREGEGASGACFAAQRCRRAPRSRRSSFGRRIRTAQAPAAAPAIPGGPSFRTTAPKYWPSRHGPRERRAIIAARSRKDLSSVRNADGSKTS